MIKWTINGDISNQVWNLHFSAHQWRTLQDAQSLSAQCCKNLILYCSDLL